MNTVTVIGFLLIVLGVMYKINGEQSKIAWYMVVLIGVLVMVFGSLLYEIIMQHYR